MNLRATYDRVTRATAMLDGECAGDCLTCTEDQSQNQNSNWGSDIPVIACLRVKEGGCDANVHREPKHSQQEKTAEGDKVIFHDHKVIFHDHLPELSFYGPRFRVYLPIAVNMAHLHDRANE